MHILFRDFTLIHSIFRRKPLFSKHQYIPNLWRQITTGVRTSFNQLSDRIKVSSVIKIRLSTTVDINFFNKMPKIVSFIKTIRQNWKKTTLGVLALTYIADYTYRTYNENELMRKYCKAASKFGEITLHPYEYPYKIVVILNPKANKGKAKKEFENYCAPILHLSGAHVTVHSTENATDARKLIESLPTNVDTLIFAGGDGTVSDALTGLLRKANGNILSLKNIPIGILPLGRTNSLANNLYGSNCVKLNNDFPRMSQRVQLLADATFAAVNHKIIPLDIMQIENIENEKLKPVCAVSSISWGCFRDANTHRDKYWYFGKFRGYAAYVFGSYNLDKPVKAILRYSAPCRGCKHCYKGRIDLQTNIKLSKSRNWWQIWLMNSHNAGNQNSINYDAIENEKCCKEEENEIESVNLNITCNTSASQLIAQISPSKLSYSEFVKEGWEIENGNATDMHTEKIYAREMYIIPTSKPKPDEEYWLSIDNEEYEVRKVKITLLQDVLNVFQSSDLPTDVTGPVN